MRHPSSLILLATTMFWTPFIALAADDDERWIDRYVENAARQEQNAALATTSITFDQLASMRGQDVLVELRNGQQRHGVVDQANGVMLKLRVALPSGYAHFELARRDVKRITRGVAP